MGGGAPLSILSRPNDPAIVIEFVPSLRAAIASRLRKPPRQSHGLCA